MIVLLGYVSGLDVEVSVEVIDFIFEYDGLVGGGGCVGICFVGVRGVFWWYMINGDILICNVRILSLGYSGIFMERWDVFYVLLVRIEDVLIINFGLSDVIVVED